MSSETLPISPARFAEAIKELSLSTLHLKVLEIRNDVAHLDYSNEQLLPYAKGNAAVLGATTADGSEEVVPDQDCIDAIKENLVVIERKLDQLKLVRAEVENRGVSWTEFQSKEEMEQQHAESEQRAARTGSALAAPHPPVQAPAASNEVAAATTNGQSSTTTSTPQAASSAAANPWTDGTFQTGNVRNGELHMDSVAGQSFAAHSGGSLTDEQLRLALNERLDLSGANGQNDEDNGDSGLHL
ncbi:hypothetical protein SEPCBS119000_001745 [Sporothrix epigloea]|uniref:Secondary alcohol dehydrogenase n=1 Tax=Sporothrix epigloea TaxID=1892477 RepID=A0ABP0DE10_9PEZI